MRIFAGVEFDHGCAQALRCFELPLVRLDEQRDANAVVRELPHDRGELVVQPGSIEPAFGGALFAFFRDDAGGMRLVRQCDSQHFLGTRHLEVERQVGRLLYPLEIVVADMPPVLAQMCGDPVAAHRRDDFRRAHRVRMIAAARIADGGDVVDINPETQGSTHAARLPGLVTPIAASSAGTSPSA